MDLESIVMWAVVLAAMGWVTWRVFGEQMYNEIAKRLKRRKK